MHGLMFNFSNYTNFVRSPGGHKIASYLRENGWDIEVLDFANFFSEQVLIDFFKSRVNSDTKFVGFSSMFSNWNDRVEKLVEYIQDKHPDIITVIGGQVPQIIDSKVNYYVQGFGERAIVAILEHHFGNTNRGLKLNEYWLTKNKNVVQQDTYPSAPMKSLIIKYEDRDYLEPDEWGTLEFSRGCIFKCKFCTFPILGVKEDYSRDAEDIEIQIKDTYDRFGMTNFFVSDETFNDSSNKLKKFASVFKKLPFRPYLAGFARADLLVSESRKQDIDYLMDIGFLTQFYGIESMNPRTAKLVGKSDPEVTLSKLLEVKKQFEKTDLYRCQLSFIVGLPFESKESLLKGYEWVKNNFNDHSIIFWALALFNNPDYNYVNDIAKNPEKYGYTLSDLVKTKSTHNSENYISVDWKNDYYTRDEARVFTDKMNHIKEVDGWKRGLFELSMATRYYDNDLKKGLQSKLSERLPDSFFIDKITKYKEKKLSL